MSARDELRKYANLLADSWTPREKTDDRVEWLYQQVRAEVLREAANELAEQVPPLEAGPRTQFERGLMTAVAALRTLAQTAASGGAAGDQQPETEAPLDHTAIADWLRSNPGLWRQIKVVKSEKSGRTLAGHVRRALSTGYMPAGSFDAKYRFESGQHLVYARYIGEAGAR